jgi:hypothetical protein
VRERERERLGANLEALTVESHGLRPLPIRPGGNRSVASADGSALQAVAGAARRGRGGEEASDGGPAVGVHGVARGGGGDGGEAGTGGHGG